MDVKINAYGAIHYDVALAHVNFANLYSDLNDLETSEQHHLKALNILKVMIICLIFSIF